VRISLVTDAWLPQINGVTTTLTRCRDEIEGRGHTVEVISPDRFRNIPCPGYPSIRLAVWPLSRVRRMLDAARPDAIHIATEGPLGLAARLYCGRRGLPFTTAFHTRFPEYLRVYAKIPEGLSYRSLRWFHGRAERTLVPTETLKRELEAHRFTHLVRWIRGVDTELFRPRPGDFYSLERPIYLYAGRVAAEKNIEAFLSLELPGSKVVVGDGPARSKLEAAYPEVHWAGMRVGDDLAEHYAGADVFVFPSRTDTFGVVMLEAFASGLPVAAYPVTGPIDVVDTGVTGILDDDLGVACRRALELDPEVCRAHAMTLSWARCAEMLLDNLAPIARPTGSRLRRRRTQPAGSSNSADGSPLGTNSVRRPTR
jgi:glycosyltransferase involved in cell wall biosynthesis